MEEHHRQGLCYNYDEPYVRGHKCVRLFYLEVSDFNADDTASTEQPNPDDQPPLISLSAITSIHTEDTMQIHLSVGNHEFTTLLDSGSTHNFISTKVAHRVGLQFHSSNAHM